MMAALTNGEVALGIVCASAVTVMVWRGNMLRITKGDTEVTAGGVFTPPPAAASKPREERTDEDWRDLTEWLFEQVLHMERELASTAQERDRLRAEVAELRTAVARIPALERELADALDKLAHAEQTIVELRGERARLLALLDDLNAADS